MNPRPLLIIAIVVLSVLLVWLGVFWEPKASGLEAKAPPNSQWQLAKAPQGGDFILQGFNGPVALKDYRGKAVLVYFGYTFCPDVCPTSLSLMAQALSSMEPAERERVQGIFVSVDPDRDTPEHLNVYAPYFHPGIIGLTGSAEQLTVVASQYGASYMKQKPNADGLYAVDHSSITYVIDPNGKLVARLPHASTPQQIVAAVRPLLAAGTSK